MTTRLMKTTRATRKPTILLHCPSCRASRRCTAVGTATVAGKRREVLQCGDTDCALTWVPAKTHILNTAPTAA